MNEINSSVLYPAQNQSAAESIYIFSRPSENATLQQQNAELRAALEFCCEQIDRYAGDDDCHGPSYRKAREVLAKYPKV